MFDSLEYWTGNAPWMGFILKITILLAVAWFVHYAVSVHRPQWRVKAWRFFAIGLLLLPLLSWTIPKYEIQISPATNVRDYWNEFNQRSFDSPEFRNDNRGGIVVNRETKISDSKPAESKPAQEYQGHSERTIGNVLALNDVTNLQNTFNDETRRDKTNPAVIGQSNPTNPENRSPLDKFREAFTGAFASLYHLASGFSFDWRQIFMLVWFAGTLSFLIRIGLRHRKTMRNLALSRKAEREIDERCRQMAYAVGCKNPIDVRISPDTSIPYLCGWFRPTIVLPERMTDPERRDDLSSVFAHELSHVRFNDLFWITLFQFLHALLWFHPMAWRIRSAHEKACEYACDEYAAYVLGNIKQYAGTLARIALELSGRTFSYSAVPMARTSKIQERLNLVMNGLPYFPLTKKWIGCAALFWFVAVASVSVFDIAYAQEKTEASEEKIVKTLLGLDEEIDSSLLEGLDESERKLLAETLLGLKELEALDESEHNLLIETLLVLKEANTQDESNDVIEALTVLVNTQIDNAEEISRVETILPSLGLDETKAEPQPGINVIEEGIPPFFLIERDRVDSSRIDAYQEAMTAFNHTLAKYDFPYPIFTFRSLQGFSSSIPMHNYSEIDTIRYSFQGVASRIGQQGWTNQWNQIQSLLESKTHFVLQHRPELSYKPDNPLFEIDWQSSWLLMVEYYTIDPGKTWEVDQSIKEYVETCKKGEVRIGFTTFHQVFAEDGPVYTIETIWKNKETLNTQKKNNSMKVGTGTKIFPNNSELIRRYRIEELTYVPKLAYLPKTIQQKMVLATSAPEPMTLASVPVPKTLAVLEPEPMTQEAPEPVQTKRKTKKNSPGRGLAREHIPLRNPDTGANLIDLTNYYNAGLEGTWHTNVSVSPESLRKLPNDLSSLPKGIQTFDDVLFDIRGIVQLLGKTMKSEGGDYPERVDGIKIGKKFERLHVLHAAGWQTSPGTTIGTYILHYTDGSHEALDIIYGQHVLDWWRYAKEKFSPVNSTIAWVGSNALAKPIILSNRISQGDKVKSSLEKIIGISLSKKDESKDAANNPIRLFKTAWENPQPELEVVSIDYISKMTDSAPFLVAMTVE